LIRYKNLLNITHIGHIVTLYQWNQVVEHSTKKNILISKNETSLLHTDALAVEAAITLKNLPQSLPPAYNP